MSVRENLRWKEWATRLRQQMMCDLIQHVTKSVDTIADETGTNKSRTMLHSRRYWNACQAGLSPNDAIVKAGFEIEFESSDSREIDIVTLKLNKTWKSIMQRVLDRRV